MEIKFNRVHTSKDLTISGIVLILGIALFFVNKGIGICLAIVGLAMLLLYKSGFKREGDATVLRRKAMDVSKSCRSSLKDFLDGKDVDPQVEEADAGAVVRLEVYYNEAEKVAYAQLFDFQGYAYEKLTEIVELHSPASDKLIAKL